MAIIQVCLDLKLACLLGLDFRMIALPKLFCCFPIDLRNPFKSYYYVHLPYMLFYSEDNVISLNL